MSKLNWWKTWCTVSLLCATTAIALPAQTFTTLYSFDFADGSRPFAGLIQATDGSLYGTTVTGGLKDDGTVFKIGPNGTLRTLYSFCLQGGKCTDGGNPYAGLIQATDGNFYGTTELGGANYYGTIFRITPTGALTTLYSFCSQGVTCLDGSYPFAGLIQATDGNLYGTTYYGGANGGGTVFKITLAGTLTTLYSFCSQSGCTDGDNPYVGGLVQSTNGDFYGTTSHGGASGFGTVFRITPGGALTRLYSFCWQGGKCTDGYSPYAGLIQGTDGNFYGTTEAGGTGTSNSGTVFRITPSGTFRRVYSFCSQTACSDGKYPEAVLVQASDGNLYGTTLGGGLNDEGTVFKLTPTGTLTGLYSFCLQSGCPDGKDPTAGLVQDTNGNFYGTAAAGGADNYGSAFSLSVDLGPFITTLPRIGRVGAPVIIMGTNLTGAIGVTFNGTPAAFTVESPSAIKTTVPVGATTGTVQVVTPSGTLSSNVPFRVAP